MNEVEPVEEIAARHITEIRFEDLPKEAVHCTKEHILHTIGTVLAGSAARRAGKRPDGEPGEPGGRARCPGSCRAASLRPAYDEI